MLITCSDGLQLVPFVNIHLTLPTPLLLDGYSIFISIYYTEYDIYSSSLGARGLFRQFFLALSYDRSKDGSGAVGDS